MEIKRKSPEIVEAFVRSDNAGCYHCDLLLLSIPGISQRTGVTTSRYDFSESNSGKDICDRHISPLKSHIRQYVNAGNDVEKAKDMKKAIDSYSGVRGCRASVVKVDTCAQDLHNHNWNGVLMFSNFKFCADGIRMWKAFNVGEGKFVRYDKLMKRGTSQGSTRLEVVEPFTSPRVSTGFLYKNSKTTENKSEPCEFSCPQPGCIKLFKTTTALQNHQDFGKHIFCTQKDSTHDSIKRKWANACTNLRPSCIPSKKNLEGLSQEECREYPTAEPGWALKKNKKTGRFSEHVKEYLLKLFLDGEETGNKSDPAVVASNLKSLRGPDGVKLFSSKDWLSAQQVTSYFSRLASVAKSGKLSLNKKTVIEEEDMLDALVERGERESMREKVFHVVDL